MRYADFRTDMSVHPVTGDLLLFIDEQAINSQIKNLVFTDLYEISWKPEIGSGVPQTLFENFDSDTEYMIVSRIRDTINKYVSRAELIDVKLNYDNHNGYQVTIIYRPVNQLEPVTLTILLTRTR